MNWIRIVPWPRLVAFLAWRRGHPGGARVADRLREQRLALSDAERRAQTDPLTGVLNRRSLIERLDVACRRAQARGLPLALLFIDLDHFKAINDTRGHLAGDACLKAVITPIQSELRQSDVIGRYGGEEFVVILGTSGATGRCMTDRAAPAATLACAPHSTGRPRVSGRPNAPTTKQSAATPTGYQSPANTLPVAATIVKATAGSKPPNQPLPKFCGNDTAE